MDPRTPPTPTSTTRLFAGAVLLVAGGTLAWLGHEVYRVATDSFVAPIILSPDNDAVLTSKLSLSQLQVERARTAAEIESIDDELGAAAKAVARLRELTTMVERSLSWTSDVNRQLAEKGALQRRAIDEQASIVTQMIERQGRLTETAEKNLKAGLLTGDDYQREVMALGQLRVTLLENQRARNELDAKLAAVRLTQDSLSRKRSAPDLPERIIREDQLVRVELEALKLEAEQRKNQGLRRLDVEKLARIDELEKQLKARPIFRAIETNLDVAFVPYTQIEGVRVGAIVRDCVWGLLACKVVGTVKEVVPGETILPDPWGNQARGQFAILDLHDRAAARSRTLRVRPLD